MGDQNNEASNGYVDDMEALDDSSQPNSNNFDAGYNNKVQRMRNTGRAMRATGNGMRAAGKTTNLAGKGMQTAGNGMTKAGTALSGTGIGAAVGAPLVSMGAATNMTGKGVSAIGKSVDTAGKQLNETGREMQQQANNIGSYDESNSGTGQAVVKAVASTVSLKTKLIIAGIGFGIFIVFFVIFAVFIGDDDDDDSGRTCVNLPAIDSVCKKIVPDGYESMSVDDYVAGVVKAESSGMTDAGLNTYKAQAIAARSYALANATKDGNGNCKVPVGPSFQAYSPNPDENMIKAAEETSGMVLVSDSSIASTQYDALCIESEDTNNYYLCQGGESEEHLTVPRSWLESKRDSGYISSIRTQVHGNGMSQNGAWYLALEKGWDYTQILDYFYGDDGLSLASINGATTNCTSSYNGNFSPLETYNLSRNGLDVLNRTLTTSEQDNLNSYINSEVDKAGFGTGAGVAAAGQSLVYWLEQQGYYLEYRWGGGHSYSTNGGCDLGGTFVGVNPNWGSTACGYDDHDSSRVYYGMDCSGFVSWAIRTACKPSGFNSTAGGWASTYGKKISLSEAKPGDVLDSSSHIQLVVNNNGDGSVIVAEESGSKGLVFSKVLSTSYDVVDMSSWYSSNCDSSR